MISEEHRDLTDSVSVEGGKSVKRGVDKKLQEPQILYRKSMESEMVSEGGTVEPEKPEIIPNTSTVDVQKVCVRR